MNLEQQKTSFIEISLRHSARIAGFGYLMIFIFSIIANFFIFEELIVSGDAKATTTNIIANQSLFRLGIASWIVVVMLDALVAWALYILLKPINESFSLLAACFRLVFVAIFGYSFVNYFSILQLLSGAAYLNIFETEQVQAQVMLLLNTSYFATRISYVFFGLHILLLGYLILKSGYIPRILGIFLIVAGCGYLIDSFGNFVSSAYSKNHSAFLIFVLLPALISELSFTFWLIFKGGKAGRQHTM